MKHIETSKTLSITALCCALLFIGCGGGAEQAKEPEDERSEGGELDEAAGESVEEMTDGEGIEEVVEEACEAGDAACEGEGGDDLDTDEEGDGPDVKADEEEADEGEDSGVDPKVAWRKRIARGKQVFIKRCDFCHPDGDEDTGPKLRGIQWPTQKIVSIVRKGKGKMKPFTPTKISRAQMRDLLAYLSTIRAARGVKRP